MEVFQDSKVITVFKKISLLLSLFIVVIGVLVLFGWQFNSNVLRAFSDTTNFMNPVSAINFILIGFSIQLIGHTKMKKYVWLSRLAGLFSIWVGLVMLVGFNFSIDTQIDLFLFRSKVIETRIAPNTSISLICIGLSLYFLTREKFYRLIQILCFFTASISLLSLLGYFYTVTRFYGYLVLLPMSLNTAIVLLLSSLAILFVKPEKGYMQVFFATAIGGKTARILIPLIIIIPSILGKMILMAENLDLFKIEFGFALFNVLLTVIFLGVIYWVATYLNKIDFERRKVGHTLLEEKTKDEAILASIGDGLIVTDNEGRITMINEAAEVLLGWNTIELLGKDVYRSLHTEDQKGNEVPIAESPIHIALTTGKKIATTSTINPYFYLRKDGSKFPAAITVTPVILNEIIVGAIEILRDVTKEKEIEEVKNEFVSIASHQLRTPLGLTKWYLEVLKKDSYLRNAPTFITDYFDVVFRNNERVLALVRELLSVSRIEQKRVKNSRELLDVEKIVSELVKELQPLAQKKQIHLSLETKQTTVPSILLDKLQFHEVVENLLVNAIEYTPVNGIVAVTMYADDTNTYIEVKDTGMGISSEEQKKLFTKFFRSQKAINKNPEGSGLGLYVAKSYVEAWGGIITVQSTEEQGSTFTVEIPISQNK